MTSEEGLIIVVRLIAVCAAVGVVGCFLLALDLILGERGDDSSN